MKDNKNNENSNEEIKTVEGNEETGNADTQTANNQNEGSKKTEETLEEKAQKLADGMFAKKMKGMPSKEELKAFKEWQELQKTDEQKQNEKETEYQKTLSEKESLVKENQVLKAGVNIEDVDYVVFKVSKMEGDFQENLTEFLENNPKYLKQSQEQEKDNRSTSNGVHTKKQDIKQDSGVMAILKAKHPELY